MLTVTLNRKPNEWLSFPCSLYAHVFIHSNYQFSCFPKTMRVKFLVDRLQSLKQFFINVSYQSNSDGAVLNRAMLVRLATSI